MKALCILVGIISKLALSLTLQPKMRLVGVGIFLLLTTGCAFFPRIPPPKANLERQHILSHANLPLDGPVEIFLNELEMPYIIAVSDADAFRALGFLHTHYRWVQIELLRYASQGRLSELAGPFAHQLDWGLRILDFKKAVPQIWSSMPEESKTLLKAFVEGINAYVRNAKDPLALPPEFKLLGIKPQPYTVEDILTFGRLIAVDVSWFLVFSYLQLHQEAPEIWQRILSRGQESAPSFVIQETPYSPRLIPQRSDRRQKPNKSGSRSKLERTSIPLLEKIFLEMLQGSLKTGSNSVVFSPKKSASGAALIANDPHLGLLLPNVWFAVGIKSKSFNMVGLSIPGTPFIALGRNQTVAWGGTNMRALSTDLYDVSELAANQFSTREEVLVTRFWRDKKITIRSTPYGPVITDLPFLKKLTDRSLSLRWMGHQPSDEITAFLKANRASSVKEFKEAFESYGVSAQNFLVVDNKGNIGHVIAAKLPRRPVVHRPDFVLKANDPDQDWKGFVGSFEFPSAFNPKKGFLASANNLPTLTTPEVGLVFSTNNRIHRLHSLAEQKQKVTVEDLRSLQLDSYSEASKQLWNELRPLLDDLHRHPDFAKASDQQVLVWAEEQLKNWKFDYQIQDYAPTLFVQLVTLFGRSFYRESYSERSGEKRSDERKAREKWVNAQLSQAYFQENFTDDLKAYRAEKAEKLKSLFYQSAKEVIKAWRETRQKKWVWGSFHQLYLGSALANLPLIGDRFAAGVWSSPGGIETLNKANHSWSEKPVRVQYGAQSRHISDMSHPDHNYFVLLGGQDGYLGSKNYLSQVDKFFAGELVQFPLQEETIRAQFKTKIKWR